MSKILSYARPAFCAFIAACALSFPSQAEDPDLQSQLSTLEKRMNEQQKQVEEQQQLLDIQAEEINKQKKQIDQLSSGKKRAVGPVIVQPFPPPLPPPPVRPEQIPQQAVAPIQPEPPQKRSAEAMINTPPPRENQQIRPEVEALANQGGILSPKGSLTFEDTIEYVNTTRNLFAFNGVELAQVVLVGGITAEAVRHIVVEETGRLRLGITDRTEMDVHVPFVYRNDNIANTVTTTGIQQTTTVEGNGLGDIDVGVARQLNDGKEGWPFIIGNLRYKANNADGPFDVPYNTQNIATRLPTGTGFQTLELSFTGIKVVDPAVLYANAGFVYDFSRNIGKNFNGTYVSSVNPGDVVEGLVGMAFAVNPDVSFSLGYKFNYVFPTVEKTNAGNISTGSSQVGSLTMGLTYVLTPATSLNFMLEAGVTNDAPDVHLVLRVPFYLGKVY